MATINIFVATAGDDTDTGLAITAPFETIPRAKSEVRALRVSNPTDDIVVNVRGGSYYLTEQLNFDDSDSGSQEHPVRWIAYDDESVVISGGAELSGITEVTTLAGANPDAIGNLLQIDLSANGVTDFGDVSARRQRMELIIDGKPMTLARYPKTGYTNMESITDSVNGVFGYSHDRGQFWENEPNLLARGWWGNDFDSELHRIAVDDSTKTISVSSTPSVYGYTQGHRYFVENALSELSGAGDWYLDVATNILYFWPPATYDENSVVQVSMLSSLARLIGSSHINFHGIEFSGSRSHAMQVNDGDNVTFTKTTVRNSGGSAISINSGVNHKVIGADISNTGEEGIIATGGDRATLTRSNHLIENAHIHNFSRLHLAYTGAVELRGVGATLRNSTIYNGPHLAVFIDGNDHTVEFNRFTDITHSCNDMGVVYGGREWANRGNVIRNNYFEDIVGFEANGNPRVNVAVYSDDQNSSFEVRTNLFVNVRRGMLVGGGKNNVLDDNVFIDVDVAGFVDARGLEGQGAESAGGQQLEASLQALPYESDVWVAAYPDLIPSLVDKFAPYDNQFTNNRSNEELVFEVIRDGSIGLTLASNTVDSSIDATMANGELVTLPAPFDTMTIGAFDDANRASWPLNIESRTTSEVNTDPLQLNRRRFALVADGVDDYVNAGPDLQTHMGLQEFQWSVICRLDFTENFRFIGERDVTSEKSIQFAASAEQVRLRNTGGGQATWDIPTSYDGKLVEIVITKPFSTLTDLAPYSLTIEEVESGIAPEDLGESFASGIVPFDTVSDKVLFSTGTLFGKGELYAMKLCANADGTQPLWQFDSSFYQGAGDKLRDTINNVDADLINFDGTATSGYVEDLSKTIILVEEELEQEIAFQSALPPLTITTNDGSEVTETSNVNPNVAGDYTITLTAPTAEDLIISVTVRPEVQTNNNVWLASGTSNVVFGTLGDITASKIRMRADNVTWPSKERVLFGQSANDSSLAEFLLFGSAGNITLRLGGETNVLGTYEEVFGLVAGQTLDRQSVDATVTASGDLTILVNDIETLNTTVTRGTTRVDGVRVRLGGRDGDVDITNNLGAFVAQDGFKAGRFRVWVDDVAKIDAQMPAPSFSDSIVNIVDGSFGILDRGDGTDFETLGPFTLTTDDYATLDLLVAANISGDTNYELLTDIAGGSITGFPRGRLTITSANGSEITSDLTANTVNNVLIDGVNCQNITGTVDVANATIGDYLGVDYVESVESITRES